MTTLYLAVEVKYMDKKFECIHSRHDVLPKGESWKYWYEPKNDIGGAIMQLTVTTSDPFALSSELGLPTNKGDTVIIKTGKKEEQGTLPKAKDEEHE